MELVRRLPPGCAYFYDVGAYRIHGLLIGGPIGLIALAGIGWAAAGTLGAVLLGLLGGLVGLLGGWFYGAKLCPTPVFLVRRTPKEEGNGYDVEPIEHSYLMGAVDPINVAAAGPPGVFLGSSWDSIIEGRAVRRFFTAAMTRGQKIQMAAIVTVAVCSVIVVFFLVMGTRGE